MPTKNRNTFSGIGGPGILAQRPSAQGQGGRCVFSPTFTSVISSAAPANHSNLFQHGEALLDRFSAERLRSGSKRQAGYICGLQSLVKEALVESRRQRDTGIADILASIPLVFFLCDTIS